MFNYSPHKLEYTLKDIYKTDSYTVDLHIRIKNTDLNEILHINYMFFKVYKNNKKFRKPLILLGFRKLSGGDSRDRTGDLLNAIQWKSVAALRVFGSKGVTGV